MIRLENVGKSFSSKNGIIQVLKDINLTIPAGKIFGIVGKSGAGKSTLLRCINLLEKPTSGKVFVNQQELTNLSSYSLLTARRQIGMIFQHFNLLSSRTAYENISLPLEISGKKTAEIEAIINPLLELTHLTDKKHSYPSQLSGGQKQRVAIARALVNNPSVLLCDEVTSALDPSTTKSILDLLKDINQQLGITILIITHEMDVIKEICDKVAIIDDGILVEQASVIDLFTNPKSKITQDFVSKSLQKPLPAFFSEHMATEPKDDAYYNPVFRIYFTGEAVFQPTISNLIREHNISINILQAHINYIKDQAFSVFDMELMGAQEAINTCMSYMEQQQLRYELLGYVKHNTL